MSFTPYLFIGIGETGAFFTLREAYDLNLRTGKVVTAHLCNLSQDADEALRKATEYAEAQAIELRTNANTLAEEMRAIQRATAAEREERARVQRVQEEQLAAQRAAYEQQQRDRIAEGVYPLGPYQGKQFEQASRSYIDWIMRKVAEFEAGSVLHQLAQAVADKCGHLRLPDADPALLVGEPKKRQEFTVTVVRSAFFDRDSWDYRSIERVWVTAMVTDAGACLVVFSSTFSPEVGEELRIKATVKSHSEYKGQAQTIVQRVTVQNKAS